jgi:DNA-binding PadR family transcriptional regulator
MAVKYALLGILAQEPSHGYDIKRAFDEKVGEFWNLNFGQIYTTLDKLEDEGFIQHDEISQQDKPDKKVYRITPAGVEELQDWLTRPLKPEPRTLRDELFIKLMFMNTSDPQPALQLIRTQQSVYLAYMMRLTDKKYQIEQNARKAASRAVDENERQHLEHDRLLNSMLIDAALFHAEADIRWLKHCEAKIREAFETK